MIVLLAALSATSLATAPTAESRVRASVQIVRGHEATSKDWAPAARPAQREIVRKEQDGRETLIRLTEFE